MSRDGLPDDHQFFKDLCEVVDKHSTTDEEKEVLMEEMIGFAEHWQDTYHMTGTMW